MRRLLALVLLHVLVRGAGIEAQAVDDALVPRGRVRLEMTPVFTTWDSRFGRAASGEERREALGEDLTVPSAELLFPGAELLRAAIESMTGGAPYTPVMGETQGRVSKDITRIEFAAHVGIFDWLTLGAVLPWTRTRTNVDVAFQPDTLNGDLGLAPGRSAAEDAFRQALSAAVGQANAHAGQACASSPGSPACASATALASRTSAFDQAARAAYDASGFFPLAGSAVATSLQQAVDGLSADLVAAGLSGIGEPMAFATTRLDQAGLLTFPTAPLSGVVGAPLGDIKGPWHAGDMELSLTARVLEGAVRSAPEAPASLSYSLLATLLWRLPTGWLDDPNVFLDVGTGDGQTDVEARLGGTLTLGRRLGIRAGARYGVQLPRRLTARVAPPEEVLPSRLTHRTLEWDPGAYWALEVAPALRLSDELNVGGEYRVFRKYRDEYTLVEGGFGAFPPPPVDPLVLQVESGVTLHEVGVTLRYDTVARWMADGTTRPLQFHGRLLRAVAGGGGQTPVTTRVEFGVRLFRRIWGPS